MGKRKRKTYRFATSCTLIIRSPRKRQIAELGQEAPQLVWYETENAPTVFGVGLGVGEVLVWRWSGCMYSEIR